MHPPEKIAPELDPNRQRIRRSKRRVAGAGTGRSITILVLIQVSSLAVPLATMPFLTRVLGPAAWGHLAAIQALALTLSIIVEYGFQYTATRSITLQRSSPSSINRIVSEVATAKIILSVTAAAMGAVVYIAIPAFRESWQMFIWGLAYSILLGWSPIWFFQGMERLERAASIEVASKIASAALIFLVVRGPDDAVLVLVAQAATTALATAVNLVRVHRAAGAPVLGLAAARRSLVDGFPLFLYRAVITVYAAGSTAVLRGMATSVEAGNYANADRLSSAAKSLIVPVGQVMFPKISRLHVADPHHAKKVMLVSLTIVTVPFAAAGGAAIAFSPWLLPLFLGPNYSQTIPMFQVLCLTLPLVAASNVLGIQWILARGRQRAFNVMIASSASISLMCMFFLVPSMGGLGMALSVTIAESVLVVAMSLYTWLTKD